MYSAEIFAKALDDLEKIDPEEWHNIPFPIIQGFTSLKNCIRIQSNIIDYTSRHVQEIEYKNNNRVLSIQKTITENTEKIKEIHDTNHSSIKAAERRLKEHIDDFQQKITEEFQTESSKLELNIKETKGNLLMFKKRIDQIINESEVQDIISSYFNTNIEKAKNNIKETIVIPEIFNLSQKISLSDV